MTGPEQSIKNKQPEVSDVKTPYEEAADAIALALLNDANKEKQKPPTTEVKNEEVQKVTDKQAAAKNADVSKIDPHELMTQAEVAAELLQWVESGKNDNEKVTLKSAQGKDVVMTVGERKQQLRDYLKKEGGVEVPDTREKIQEYIDVTARKAITIADAIQQTPENPPKGNSIQELLADNEKRRNALAEELGFKPTIVKVPDASGKMVEHKIYDITPEAFEAKARQIAPNTPEWQKISELAANLSERDKIRDVQVSPSFMRLRYAELLMAGMTDKDAKVKVGEGEIKPSQREIMNAYEMVNQAGRLNTAVSDTPQYQDVKARSSLLYADIQQQRSAQAIESLKVADKMRQEGKPEAEVRAKYEEALKKVQEVDMSAIRSQILTQNKELARIQEAKKGLDKIADTEERERTRQFLDQQEQAQNGIITSLGLIVHAGKEVKVEYAKYLNERGKHSEALPLLTSTAAEAPEFVSEQVDPTFGKELEKAMAGTGTLVTGDTEKHRQAYETAMAEKNWAKASEELGILKAAAVKANDTTINGMKSNVEAMAKRKAEIDTELGQIARDEKQMDEQQKALRKDELEREKKMLEQMEKSLKEGLGKVEEAAKKQMHQIMYMEGIIAYSRDDKETANKIFKELQKTSPELAAISGDPEQEAALTYLEQNFDKINKNGNEHITAGEIDEYLKSNPNLAAEDRKKLEYLKAHVDDIEERSNDEWFDENDGITRADLKKAKEEVGTMLGNLIEATRKRGWLERNWDKIKTVVTIGGAVIAGIAVGIAVGCLTGPGGILAGIGTTGAILTAAGVGAVAGATWYASTNYAGIEIARANDWKSTNAYWEKHNVLGDVKTGAFIGATSAAGQVIFAPGGALATTLANGGRLGTALTTGARFATSWGGAPAVGYTGAIGHQTYEMIANGKSLKEAAGDAAIEGAGYTAALWSAGRTGGLTNIKNASMVGLSISGQQQAREVILRDKQLFPAAMDLGMDSLYYTLLARAAGSAAQNAPNYQMARLTKADYVTTLANGQTKFNYGQMTADLGRAFAHNAGQEARWLGTAAKDAILMDAKTTRGKILAATLNVGSEASSIPLEMYANYQSNKPKDLTDEAYQRQITERIEANRAPIQRPKVNRSK